MPRADPNKPIEPIWLLRAISYTEYRQSVHWRRRRTDFIQRMVEMHGYKRCDLCSMANEQVSYHVHHITYAHIGYELDEDLTLLCSPCHNLVHYPESSSARHWVKYNAQTIADLEDKAQELNPRRVDELTPTPDDDLPI